MTPGIATAGRASGTRSQVLCGWVQWLRERRRHVAIALVSLAYLVAAGISAAAVTQPPQLAARLSVPAGRPASITWVVPGSTLWELGVREGDRVLRLNGFLPVRGAIEDWHGRTMLLRTKSGALVAADAAKDMHGRETWPLLVSSPVFLLLASLILLRAPHPIEGRAAYGLFGSAAFALALAPGADADVVAATVAEWLATGFLVRRF